MRKRENAVVALQIKISGILTKEAEGFICSADRLHWHLKILPPGMHRNSLPSRKDAAGRKEKTCCQCSLQDTTRKHL